MFSIQSDLRLTCQTLGLRYPYLTELVWHNAPYHNKVHCLLVSLIALMLSGTDEQVTPTDRLVLLYAALFHDAWHPGLNLPDSINIPLALNALDAYSRDGAVTIENELYAQIAAVIRCTKYPYDGLPSTLVGRYLRDADLLVMTHPARGIFLRGLAEELKFNEDGITQLTEARNAEFLRTCEMGTQAGKLLMFSYLQAVRNRQERASTQHG